MTAWTFVLRDDVKQRVDASPLRLADWDGKSIDEVNRTTLAVGGQHVPLADLFSIQRQQCDEERLVVEGDLRCFDRIAHRHERGIFHVIGSVGDYAGDAMSGGFLAIEGDAGDYLASPQGAARQGMRGGRATVAGSAGDYAGHRMRRGEILIEGDAGRFTAGHMVAGTVIVAGKLGDDTATGMRRGTLISSQLPDLPTERFSSPVVIHSVYPRLIRWGATKHVFRANQVDRLDQLIHRLVSVGVASRRGDRAVNGKGEIVSPADRMPDVERG